MNHVKEEHKEKTPCCTDSKKEKAPCCTDQKKEKTSTLR